MFFSRTLAWATAALLIFVANAHAQTIIYVNQSASPGGSGQSWASPYSDLPSGLTAAQAVAVGGGTAEVWVAAGTYQPSGTFQLRSHVSLLGGFAGNETLSALRNPRLNLTILDGAGTLHVVTGNGADSTAILDGFVIRNGAANGPTVPTRVGAGLTCEAGSSPSISNCVFIQNRAENGGSAVYVDGSNSMTFNRCRFLGNGGPASNAGAGAVKVGYYGSGQLAGQTRFLSCEFSGNNASAYGGGIAIASGTATLINCTFYGNSGNNGTAGQGSAIEVDLNGFVNIENCVIWGQVQMPALSTYEGGTIFIDASCLQGGQPGIYDAGGGHITYGSNTSADPLFQSDPVGPDGIRGTLDDDLRLSLGPATDSGNNSYVPADMPADIDGNRRIFRATSAEPPSVDMGSHELGAAQYTNSTILFVRQGATGRGDGTSWADAFPSALGLRDALAVTTPFPGAYSQVWVAAGTYTPSSPLSQGGSRSASFQLQNNLAIYGGFAGTETDLSQRNIAANPTILSGDLSGDDNGLPQNLQDNSYHVLTGSGTTIGARLDGFIIRGGNANSGGFSPPYATPDDDACGGAILVKDGTLTIANCQFTPAIPGTTANTALSGGAIAIRPTATVLVTDCLFQNNKGGSGPGGGGAILTESMPRTIVRRCQFAENSVGGLGYGGAVLVGVTAPAPSIPALTISECTFTRNSAAGAYSSAVAADGSYTWIENSRFFGNTGAATVTTSSLGALTVVGCAFAGNDGTYGSVTVADEGTATVQLCTFAGNVARNNDLVVGGGGGGVYARSRDNLAPCNLTIGNSVLWQNSFISDTSQIGQIYSRNANVDISRCIVGGWTGSYGGTANNGLNPLFLRPPSPGPDNIWGTPDDDYGDLHVALNSPAIDSGDSTAVPPDTYDINANGNTTEALPLDLDGQPRFYDYANVANTGNGSPPVDRGCYEFTPPDTSVPGDRRWINPAGGAYSTNFNWFPGMPGPNDNAVFDIPGSYSVTMPSTTTSNQLADFRNGSVSLNLSNSTFRLTSNVTPSLVVGDSTSYSPQLSLGGGTLSAVEGRIGSTPGSTGTVNLTSSVSSHPTLSTSEGLCIGCAGTGTLNISGGGRASCLFGTLGEETGAVGHLSISGPGSRLDAPFFLAVDSGDVRLFNSGALATSAFGAIYLFPNGTLTGDSTVTGHLVNFGTVAPSTSTGDPAMLSLSGDYDQVGQVTDLGPASGSLNIRIGGASLGQFDMLAISGDATLGGGLIVPAFLNSYTPGCTTPTWRVLSAANLTGTFDVAYLPVVPDCNGHPKFMQASYDNTGVTLGLADLLGAIGFGPPTPQSVDGVPSAAIMRSTHAGDPNFDPSRDLATDFDGDGLPDLAVAIPAANNPGQVVIFFNAGFDNDPGHTWRGFRSQADHYTVGHTPSALAVADFRLLGRADIAVANASDNTVMVLSNDGAGHFAITSTIAVGQRPVDLAAGNLDRSVDPTHLYPSLVVANSDSSSLTILQNNRDGQNPGFILMSNTPTPVIPRGVRVTHTDGDKRLGLILLGGQPTGGGSSITPYQNDGFANFTALQSIPVGNGAFTLTLSDLDNDGVEDIITANAGTDVSGNAANSVSILLHPQIGSGYLPAVNLPLDGPPTSLTALDAENDHDTDLAVVVQEPDSTRTVQLLRNDLSGNQLIFAPAAQFPSGTSPLFVLAADVNQDSRTDLITINDGGGLFAEGIQVRPNTSTAPPPPHRTCTNDFNGDGDIGTDADIEAFFACLAGNCCPTCATADFNGDGDIGTDADIESFFRVLSGGPC